MKTKRLLALLLSLCLVAALAFPVTAVEEDPTTVPEETTAVVLEASVTEEPVPIVEPVFLMALEEPAAPKAACDCGEVVQVFVKGFLHPLYYDYGTENQREAFVLGHFLMNDQGESVLDIDKHWLPMPEQVGNHKNEPEFEFLYDYRMDPFSNAEELGDFIDYLREATGHEKIALTGMSQGTSIVTTYLMTEGYDKLESLILISGSYQGVTVMGELLTNRLALSLPAIINLVATLSDNLVFKAFMNLLRIAAAPFETGPSGNAKILGGKLYNWIIMKLAGQMPAIWTFLPESYYPEARKLLTGNEKYAKLLAWADEYNYNIRPKVPAKLQAARDAGVKVAIIAHYGKAPIPLIKTNYKQTDILIDTEYGSCGATVAPIGKILTSDQINDPAYLSPDGIIDSSTCALPDQTWFIKNIGHQYIPSYDLRMKIIHHDVKADGYPSIKSYEEFPQYLRLTADKEHTEPLTKEPAPPQNISEAFSELFGAMGF